MNSVVIISFTDKGYELSERLEGIIADTPGFSGFSVSVYKKPVLKELIPSIFKKGNIIVFISAAGIAVRAIAGLIKDKTKDPAVLVIDELGRYIIPILSGHTGGANSFSKTIGGLISAVPVITTATDINGVFSVDSYAAQNGYEVANPAYIKYISSALLGGGEVGLYTPFEVCGTLPDGITLKNGGDIGILIADFGCECPFEKTLRLIPKRYHVGVGARKGIGFDALNSLLSDALKSKSVKMSQIGSISSISLKKDEQAILRLCELYGVNLITYPPERLKEYEEMFECSEFVKNVTGAGSVCEASAYLSSNMGELILGKTAKDGAAIAIAVQNWRVVF